MTRQAVLPSFDDQLRLAIRQAQIEENLTQRDLAKHSGVTLPSISKWANDSTKTIRFDTAEKLARSLQTDLRTTRAVYQANDPRRRQSFDEQFQLAIGDRDFGELSKASEVPASRLEWWKRYGCSKLLLREVFAVCLILQADLLVNQSS